MRGCGWHEPSANYEIDTIGRAGRDNVRMRAPVTGSGLRQGVPVTARTYDKAKTQEALELRKPSCSTTAAVTRRWAISAPWTSNGKWHHVNRPPPNRGESSIVAPPGAPLRFWIAREFDPQPAGNSPSGREPPHSLSELFGLAPWGADQVEFPLDALGDAL